MMGGMGRGIARQRMGLENSIGIGVETELRFKKTGADIQASISKKIEGLVKHCSQDEKEIAEICERRQLDAKEVIDAANDEEATVAYESKVSNSLGIATTRVTNKVAEELQKDLTMLKQLSASIAYTRTGIENLNRILKNIEPKREFDLDYQELSLFGF